MNRSPSYDGRFTIVALGDTVLDAPTLCEVRDLGPVLVWVGVWAECKATFLTRRNPTGKKLKRRLEDLERRAATSASPESYEAARSDCE
jgi:hypothetical protein